MTLKIERASLPERDWHQRPTHYEVSFWESDNPEPPLLPLWTHDPFVISGEESIFDVIQWAEENARGRAYEIEAVVTVDGRVGYVHLHGTDPTTSEELRRK
jgi:hypothetical protein